jgi:hypothetical protein
LSFTFRAGNVNTSPGGSHALAASFQSGEIKLTQRRKDAKAQSG